ncbi:MAG: hypothetical protein ACRENZ_00205 [Thermodesulfobacteriota bacterium]
MAQFTINANATSNGSANTDDVFVRSLNTAAVSALVKRIRVSFPATTPADFECQVTVQRISATAAATTSAFTPLKRRQNSPSSTTTAQIKSGTNAFGTGTVTDTVIKAAVNTRSVFEWIARDEYDYIEAALGTTAGVQVTVQVSSASQLVNAELDFEE